VERGEWREVSGEASGERVSGVRGEWREVSGEVSMQRTYTFIDRA
jgi:hypothetical protein